GEQAMADLPMVAPAAGGSDHALMLMHAVHSEPAHHDASAAAHAQQMHHSSSHSAVDASTGAAEHPAGCETHDCCPAGACDCACVNLTPLLSSSAAVLSMTADAALAAAWLQPAPPQRPERVFRPPA